MKKSVLERAIRAARAVTGTARQKLPTRIVSTIVWITAAGIMAVGCNNCLPTWGPTAPPEAA